MVSLAQEKLLLEAASHYSQEINEETLNYLEERGISEVVAARFQLGTIADPIAGHENYIGWLSIPYITALNLIAGFKFRRLDDGKPKYGSPLGQKSHLYNVTDVLLDSHCIVICEGELDTVILSGECGIAAVGVPGVAAWKPHFAKLFTGYDTIYIIGDNDIKEDGTNPGAEFSKRVASEVLNSTIISLPPTMDVNDYYLAHGVNGIKKLLGEKSG
jgi:DNA primase